MTIPPSDRNPRFPKIGVRSSTWRLVLIAVLGLGLSTAAFWIIRGSEDDAAELEFAEQATRQVASLQKNLDATLDTIRSLHALFEASVHVDREEFRTFTLSVTKDRVGIQALEWIPRVTSAEREAFEDVAREVGFVDFEIRDRLEQGQMARATDRDEYFPVFYVEPLEGNEAAVGFDLASDSARLATLNKAIDTGLHAATSRITLVQERGDQYGVLVVDPLFADGQEPPEQQDRGLVMGFLLGVVRVGDIVEQSISEEGLSGIFVFDQSTSSDDSLLYPKSAPYRGRTEIRLKGCIDNDIAVADRTWLVASCPVGSIWLPSRGVSRAVFISGLIITIAVMLNRASAHRGQARVAASNARYRYLVDDAYDMVQQVDNEGRLIFVNKA
ncbi:MAG: CHASE domain-containing protein, partial [Acidimicrobiia bacterium]